MRKLFDNIRVMLAALTAVFIVGGFAAYLVALSLYATWEENLTAWGFTLGAALIVNLFVVAWRGRT